MIESIAMDVDTSEIRFFEKKKKASIYIRFIKTEDCYLYLSICLENIDQETIKLFQQAV